MSDTPDHRDRASDSVNDPRADIREADVVDVIGSHAARFDAILLDVDNGPEGLIRKANNELYDLRGLKAIRRALRPGGTCIDWRYGARQFSTSTIDRRRG